LNKSTDDEVVNEQRDNELKEILIKELIDFRKYEAYAIICCGDYQNAEK
jgi:hypothetical protein